jgi:hypothetical protein
MLKILALVFGTIFILLGILGFIPAAAPNNMFLGIFPVDGPLSLIGIIEDSVSLLAGIIAVGCGLKGPAAAKRYFQILGGVFLFLAFVGFVSGDQPILGFIPNNKEDIWFNFVFAVLFISIGVGVKTKNGKKQQIETPNTDVVS